MMKTFEVEYKGSDALSKGIYTAANISEDAYSFVLFDSSGWWSVPKSDCKIRTPDVKQIHKHKWLVSPTNLLRRECDICGEIQYKDFQFKDWNTTKRGEL